MSRTGQIQLELDSAEVRTISFSPDSGSLADVLAAAGFPLNLRCGQRGLCRGCEVELRSGTVKENENFVTAPAIVKACRAHLGKDVTIHLPSRSRLEHRPQVGDTFEIAVPYAHQPLFAPVPDGRDTAFAVDIGTTTVVVLLVDLVTGEVLSRAGAFNEQIRFGDNVVTRIEAARDLEKRKAMQRAIVTETIQPLLLRASERAGRMPSRIAGGAIVGNTTMLHLLVGEDPTPLGIAPFTPGFIAGKQIVARDIALVAEGLASDTPMQLLPGIAGYIGADITAGIFATGMAFDFSPSLLVDIGTNGEVVLQSSGKLFGCATAAGPAFEGCGLSCGTRARAGAVSVLEIQSEPFRIKAAVIGGSTGAKADGICGSAYLDFLATGRRTGLLSAAGRFENKFWSALPEINRINSEHGRAIRIADDVRVGEADVALLLQAKAAIGAGIEALLDAAGIRASELGRVYLAGGFGMHLNVQHAIDIGLLPGISVEQVRVVGNTALAGALLALVDRTSLDEMESIRKQVEVVELNLTKNFEDRYTEHLLLP